VLTGLALEIVSTRFTVDSSASNSTPAGAALSSAGKFQRSCASKSNCTTIRLDLTQCQMLVGLGNFDCAANCVSALNCVNSLLWVELDRSTVSGPNIHLSIVDSTRTAVHSVIDNNSVDD